MNPEYTVIWNGAKDGPGDALLFVKEQAHRPAPPISNKLPPKTVSGAIRELRSELGAEWFGAHRIMDLTGCTNEHAHNALNNLYRQGVLVRQRKQPMTARGWSRQVYRFASVQTSEDSDE